MARYDAARGEFTDWWRNIYAIYKEYQEGRGPVYLDMSGMSEAVRQRWEDEGKGPHPVMKLHGLNPRRDRIELIPGLHTFLGGMRINSRGESSLAGLYGAGEAAGQAGVFGADRVGSGIGAAQVFGHRAGKNASEFVQHAGAPSVNKALFREERDRIRSFSRKKGEDPFALEKQVKEISYRSLGISRDGQTLRKAAADFHHLRTDGLPKMRARDAPELAKAQEVRNLALTGEMVSLAALMRQESRGQHRREDFPATDNAQWLKWITVVKSREDMDLGAVPVPIERYKVKP